MGANLVEYTAILEQLTGPSAGAETRLSEDKIFAVLGTDKTLAFTKWDDFLENDRVIAVLRRTDTNYAISVENDQTLWINRRGVKSANLRDGDMIEFGDAGPMVRYHRFDGSLPLRWTIAEMAGDSLAYLRFSRKPLGYRLRHSATQFGWRLIWKTTVAYRVTVVISIIALAGLAFNQYQTNLSVNERMRASLSQLETFEASLKTARDEALKPDDLVELRQELSRKVSANVDRLAELEHHSDAVKRVIREATGSVAFLQLEYNLIDVATGIRMRHVLNENGLPVMLPQGQPFLALNGTGPVAGIQLTGTGFLLKNGNRIATNRHVALPWEYGRYSGTIRAEVLKPEVTKFTAYFPNRKDPLNVSLLRASEVADLALLTLETNLPNVEGVDLSDDVPVPGEEVVLLGYPTGLRSLLAQSGVEFVKRLQASNDFDFWSVSQHLSDSGLIFPLASRGITAQVTSEALVYDAETTSGGSGGPVFNLRGEVVAINAAILPEFGGSNLGVPAAKLLALSDFEP